MCFVRTISLMLNRIKYLSLLLICCLLLPTSVATASKPLPLHSQATSWVVMDGLSGFVMHESKSRSVINPGELVHLMTLYTALEIIAETPEKMYSSVDILPEDALRSVSPRRLYLVNGEPTSMQRLLNGIAVVAAEDAALAVSRFLSGSHEAFVERMNREAKNIGMNDSVFTSPITDNGNRTTAHDLAKLAVIMHQHHPDEFRWFSQKEFIFTNHTQRNRNLMLWKSDDIGGIMANASSTDIISSWHREQHDNVMARHIFAVLIGGKDADAATNDMLTLLRAGRLDYETVRLFPAQVPIKRIDILTGNRDKLEVGSTRELWVTVKRRDIASRGTGGFSSKFQYLAPAVAPVQKGDKIGVLSVFFENKHISDFDLVALHDVGLGSFLSRFVDSVRLRMKPNSEEVMTTSEKTN